MMIEFCSKRRMILSIALLGGLSILIIILESRHLHTADESVDIHEDHPILKEKLKPENKCWKTEAFEVVKDCDFCTDKEIANQDPIICIGTGRKELVRCKKSETQTYRSCLTVPWLEEKRYWTFEGVLTIFGFFSALCVFVRQKQLDHRMYQRIQRQIASGV